MSFGTVHFAFCDSNANSDVLQSADLEIQSSFLCTRREPSAEGTYDEETYTLILQRYLSFDNDMTVISVAWRDCQQLLDNYNDEQVCSYASEIHSTSTLMYRYERSNAEINFWSAAHFAGCVESKAEDAEGRLGIFQGTTQTPRAAGSQKQGRSFVPGVSSVSSTFVYEDLPSMGCVKSYSKERTCHMAASNRFV